MVSRKKVARNRSHAAFMTITEPFDPPARAARTFVRTVRRRLSCFLVGAAALAACPARAAPAVRIGARGGVDLREKADAFTGLELRLSLPLSPLTINPTFDYVFDQERTLYEASVNALLHLPLPLQRLASYVGVGFDVTTFGYKKDTPGVDGHGSRLGLNLVAGACFDLPVVSPFVQVLRQFGELDHTSLGAGLLVALDRDARWNGCGRRAP